MAVAPVRQDRARVTLVDGALFIRDLTLTGAIAEVAADAGAADAPAIAERIVIDAAEVGATLMRHGQTQALVNSVKTEIDRLLSMTGSATEQLPAALAEKLQTHFAKLAELLDGHFDPKRTESVQNQLAATVNGATAQHVRKLMHELLGERGPITAMNERVIDQLRVVSGASTDLVETVTALAERVEAKLSLDEAHERGTQKGATFEEVLHAELNAVFSPFGDEVRCVKKEYGLLPNSQAGDFVIEINPKETAGVDVRLVVEAKTGKLTAPKTREAVESAQRNRGAAAAVIVFDGVGDAPLNGRHFGQYGQDKFVVVFDSDEFDPLALEVACRHARAIALASIKRDDTVDAKWLLEQCRRLSALIESGRDIRNGANAARRGLDKVDASYAQLRSEALAVIDEITKNLDGSDE